MKSNEPLLGVTTFTLYNSIVLNSQQETTNFTGPYLRQNPPGIVPEIFAQGIVSADVYEFTCCSLPDETIGEYTLLRNEILRTGIGDYLNTKKQKR